jgi:hypothetical protein
VQVEVIDIAESAELPSALVARLVQTQLRQRSVAGLAGVLQVQVPEHGAGMLWIDGKVERLLPRARTRSGSSTATCRWNWWTCGCRRWKSRARRS